MCIVLAKGKLLKLFKASAESQLVTEILKSKSLQCEYFGHKIENDNNKKLGMHKAVHVCASDGTLVWPLNSQQCQQKTLTITRKNPANSNTKNS